MIRTAEGIFYTEHQHHSVMAKQEIKFILHSGAKSVENQGKEA
jgi:hypothetical protein